MYKTRTAMAEAAVRGAPVVIGAGDPAKKNGAHGATAILGT